MDLNLDKSNFRRMILESPKQLRTGLELAKGVKVAGSFKAVMISGMGGSALPGNLLRIYLHDLFREDALKIPPLSIYQNRSYELPPESYVQCLNLICSYSGNTEETIASFEDALKHNFPCVAFSSGGKIETLAQEHGIPHIKLPVPFPDFQPRLGIGYFFGAMFQVLVNQGLVPDTTAHLLSEAENLEKLLPELETEGQKLAKKLTGKTPVIYASAKYKALAMIWKIQFNENAKTPAFWNFFPELNHNEMVGFTLPQTKFFVIMLRDKGAHPQYFKRFEMTAKLLREKGVEVEILDMKGDSVYTQIFATILLGNFVSYYLALIYGEDPTPVDMVEKLKKLLV